VKVIYSLAIHLYGMAIRVASWFDPKARAWVKGRKGLFGGIAAEYRKEGKTVWFHCASLGEFEQGRPVMEALRARDPQVRIVLTFFSPSGYEVRKNYRGADHVFYLPLDTRRQARRFLGLIDPDLVVFVKYEFWYHFLDELRRREVPVVLISAIFRPGQWFFRWYGRWFLRAMEVYRTIFVQDERSARLLRERGLERVVVAGDTRFDRVVAIARSRKQIEAARRFSADRTVVVAGSTWREDETLLLGYLNARVRPYKWIIAPHEIHPSHISWLQERVKVPSLLFSEAEEKDPAAAEVMIIDNIGMLSSLYAYGKVAYIGGGFGAGIHNVLEAAVYGMPVLFGPRYGKFREAVDLVERKAAFPVHDGKDLEKRLNILYDDLHAREEAAARARSYVEESAGSTRLIVDNLLKFL